MTWQTMYPATPGSPYTTLASGIDDDDTSISLTADPGFAAATNLACIWDDTGAFEVVKYTDLTGTTLTVERAFEGTAQAWSAGAYIANLIPAYAINSLQNNVDILAAQFGIQSIIGIEWDSSSSSPELKRIDVNGDEIQKSTFNRAAFFDNYAIHGNMKRCTLTSAGVATFGDDAKGTGLTLTGDYVMVRIPKTYIKFEYSDPYWRWWISPTPATGFSLHPAFYQRGHSASPVDQVYVGAYTAGANGGTTTTNGASNTLYATSWSGLKLTSKSGVKNLTGSGSSGTMAQFEAAGATIGTGWGLTNFHTLNLLQMLFYIEYASFDSQSKVGLGRTNASNSAAALTGTYLNQVGEGAGTDIQSLLASNGTYGSTTNDYHSVVWRGIENPWGNIWQFVPGYNTTDTSHRILNRDGTGTIANVLTAGNYEEITDPIPINGTTNISGTDAGAYCHGYVSALARDSGNILGPMFVPGALSGASDTYLTDYLYSHQSGISQTGVLLAGGGWYYGAKAGIGCRNSNNGPANVHAFVGGRVEFLG